MAVREPFLDPLDLNFWRMDSPTTPQDIGSLCVLDRPPVFSVLIERVGALIDRFPRMRMRVAEEGRPRWRSDTAFDLLRHVTYHHLPHCSTLQQILEEASEEFSRGLDRLRPLWKIAVFSSAPQSAPPATNGAVSAILFMTHHSLADGIGALEIISALTSKDQSRSLEPRSGSDEHLPPKDARLRIPRSVLGAIKLAGEILIPARSGPLNGANSRARRIHTIDVPLGELQTLKRRFHVSLNDVFLTIIARAIHAFRPRAALGGFRALMPVAIRRRASRWALGNHLTGVSVAIGTRAANAVEQLLAIHKTTSHLKRTGAAAAYALLGVVNAKMPARIQRFICELFARRTSFICTNIPEAAHPRHIAGSRITGNYGLAALMRNHGLAFSLVTYSGLACITIVSDPAVVPDAKPLLEHLLAAKNELLAAPVPEGTAPRNEGLGR